MKKSLRRCLLQLYPAGVAVDESFGIALLAASAPVCARNALSFFEVGEVNADDSVVLFALLLSIAVKFWRFLLTVGSAGG